MPEENTNEEVKETVWKSIDEVLEELHKTHYVETRYRGKLIRFGWKELNENETVPPIDYVVLTKLEKKEQEKIIAEWLKKDFLKKVMKAGSDASCTNENGLSEELWDSLPQRLKNILLSQALEIREGYMSDFFSL